MTFGLLEVELRGKGHELNGRLIGDWLECQLDPTSARRKDRSRDLVNSLRGRGEDATAGSGIYELCTDCAESQMNFCQLDGEGCFKLRFSSLSSSLRSLRAALAEVCGGLLSVKPETEFTFGSGDEIFVFVWDTMTDKFVYYGDGRQGDFEQAERVMKALGESQLCHNTRLRCIEDDTPLGIDFCLKEDLTQEYFAKVCEVISKA